MNVNDIIDIYKDDLEGAIDTLLTEGLSKIRSLRFYDAEPFFEKAYSLSCDLIKTENQKGNDKELINQNEMKFADVFSKYTFSLFIQNTKNPLKFIDVVTKFKKQNEETNKELCDKVIEVVLNDCDIFYPRYCSDLNSNFYMTWNPFPYISQKLDTDNSGLSLQTLIKYLKILKRCSTSLKSSTITEISCSIMNNFINHYDKDLKNNKKKLRTVDETKFKNFILLLQKFLKGSNLKQLEKFENDVLFDFLTSDFLGKQFYALTRFNSYNTFSKELTEQFHQRDIINKLLQKSNLHHELIQQFSLFLSKLFEYGFYEDSIIEQLWIKTFEKSDEYEDYFEAWPTIQQAIPNKNQKYFWKLLITKTPTFSSPYIRTFLIKIAGNCNEKDKIEMVNLLWKSAIESQKSEEFVDVINEYIPNDNDFRNDLKQRCFSLFQKENNDDEGDDDDENGDNVIFALMLLIKIWKNVDDDENKTHDDFDFLLKNCTLNINNAVTFLNLLSTMAKNFVKPLTDEELELIKQQIVEIISINSIYVFNFIQGLLNNKKGRLFSSNSLFSLLEWLTKLPSVDSVTFKLIRYLYEMIYSRNKKRKNNEDTTDYLKKAIDSLWDLLYRTDIPDVADFLVKIYMKKYLSFSKKKMKSKSDNKKKQKNSKSTKNKRNNESESVSNELTNDLDTSVVNDFIDKCFQKLECFGSLMALNFLISEIEDSLNLDKYNIHRNVFNGYKQTLTIHLTRDYTGEISVPEGTSYYSFRKMVRDLIKANDSQITLMSGQEKLDRNHVFKHNEKIKVFFNTFDQNGENPTAQQKKKNDENNDDNDDSDSENESESVSESSFSFDINSFDIEWKKENLPSHILDKNRDKIKSLLDNDDTLICEAALNLLNHLSIDENEVDLLKTKSDLFDINHPFLFIYRLNLLANLIVMKDLDVLTNIFNSDLYSQLINIVFTMDRKSFTKDEYCDLLLETVVDINRIGSETKELKKLKRSCMKNLIHDSDSSFTSIMNWIIEEQKIKPINTVRVIDFLVILADFIQIDKKLLLDHQMFPEFFDLTLFNGNQEIRSTFFKVLTYIKTTRIQEFALSRLSFSRKENCNEYFLLIKRIAKFSQSYENSKFLFDTLVDSLNDNLFIYKNIKVKTENQSLIDAARDLCADLAHPEFIHGIIDTLEFIFPIVYERKNEEEEEEEEKKKKEDENENELIKKPELLIHILVDKIIFNTNRFVCSPPSLLNLVKMILNRFPSLFSPLIQSLTKFNESMGNIKNSYLNLYSSDKKTEKGLNNLGCTCYLNASIQQLFHIKEIRNAIFSYDPHINEQENEEEENDEISKNWLCQLQLLMANLKYAPLSSIDASGFVNNWKMYGNDPIDPNEQQDAVEFLQILLDRLDESIPGKPISKCVRGQIIHTIKQINGEFQSQSYEDFITFTLEVINKKNFAESCDAFLEPDIFDGDNKYNIEEIGQIDAARYHAIKKAPEILIFQLKRFDFDLSSLTRKKINSEYKVDLEVDISRLLFNNSHPCIYELFGIIEHSGSAEGGHYISYIKSNDNDSDFTWKVYNDSRVSNIDEKEVIKSATGGVYTRRFYDPITQTVKTLQSTKIDSAYILFYRKKKNENIEKKKDISDSEIEEDENSKNEIINDDLDCPIQFMPEIMLHRFFNNMRNLILRHVLFSNEYIKFMDYISTVDNFSTFSFIYQYTMKSIISSTTGLKSSSIIQTAMNKASNDIHFARYILKKKNNLLIHALINFTDERQAKISCDLANAAISIIYKENEEKHSYKEDKEFIDSIIELKDELIQHTDKFDFIFRPFYYYLKLEDVSYDLSKKYLDFFMDLLESIEKRDKEESIKNHRSKFGKYKSAFISPKSDGSDTNIGIEEAQKKMNVSYVKEKNQINIHERVDFKNINMMHVFKSILILIEKNDFEKEDKDYYHSIKEKVIKSDFMDLWSQSRYHAFNFNSLIIHFLKDDKKMTNRYFNFLCKANELPVENEENDDESTNNSEKNNENEIKTKGKVKFNLSKKSKNKNKNKNHHHHNHDISSQNNIRESSRKSSQKMTIQKLSAIFVNLLTFRDSLTSYRIQWFFEFTEKLKWTEVECGNFLRESSLNIKNHFKELNLLSSSSSNLDKNNENENQIIIDSYPLFENEPPYLIKKFLLGKDPFIRSSCVSFIYSISPSFPRIQTQNGFIYQGQNLVLNSNENFDSNTTIYNFNPKVKFVKESESKVGVNVKESESESDHGDSDASEHSVHEKQDDDDENESEKQSENDHFIGAQKNCELQSMIKLFNILMNMIKDVANISKEIAASIETFHDYKAIPTDSYFEVLSWLSYHLIEFSHIAKEEELNTLKQDEIEFLKKFDLSCYSTLFTDLIVKFSTFKNNSRSSIIDLLRFIYIVFKKSNSSETTTKKNQPKSACNLIIDQSNSITYLNAVSHFPTGVEQSNFIDNATVYLLPIITPFADKIEGHILKSKFIEMSLKSSICSKSVTQYKTGIEENYYNNNNRNINNCTSTGNMGFVLSEFIKKLKVSEKLCSLLWKKRRPPMWGKSSLLIDISSQVIKNGGYQAVNYFTEFACINSIIVEFQSQSETQQLNFFTWESMLKLIHLYNRCYLRKLNGENVDEELKSDSDESGEVKSSENNKNGKNSKSSHNFLKKFTKNFTELWKTNFKFISIVNGYMAKGIEKYNKFALKVIDDIFLKGGQISSELSHLGLKLIAGLPDNFYSSLKQEEIREKYAKFELEIINRNRSKSETNGEKSRKNKPQKNSNQNSSSQNLQDSSISSQVSVKNIAEKEAQKMIQTKLFNSDLFELFVNEVQNDESKGQLYIDFLTNFTDLSQINDAFISESIEFLRKSGYRAIKIEKSEEKVVMTKKEKKKLDSLKSEKETDIDYIVNNVNGLIEKAVLQIKKAIDGKDATEIKEKIVLGEKLMKLLCESLNAEAKFVPGRKKEIEKALSLLGEKRKEKDEYEQLFQVLERILPNEEQQK